MMESPRQTAARRQGQNSNLDETVSNDSIYASKMSNTKEDVVTRKKMPRLSSVPFLSKVSLLIRDTRTCLDATLLKKGPVVLGNLDRKGRALLLSNDGGFAEVMSDENHFTKHISPQMSVLWQSKTFLGDSLLTANSDSTIWKHSRKLMDPIFGRQGVARHFEAMCLAAETVCQKLQENVDSKQRVDLAELGVRATLHTIMLALFTHTTAMFTTNEEAKKDDVRLSKASSTLLEQFVKRAYTPNWIRKIQGEKEWLSAGQCFHERLNAILNQRKEGSSADNGEGQKQKDDILTQMLDVGMDNIECPSESSNNSAPSNNYQSDEESHDRTSQKEADALVQQLTLLLVAGHETSGSAIGYLLDNLCKHPEVQDRVRNEAISAGFGETNLSSKVDSNALKKLSYTEQVVLEGLRMNPPAPALLRVARHDMTVRTSDGQRFEVRKGDLGSLVISSLHTNPSHWGSDAHCFRPERFSPEERSGRHPYAFLAFASGARGCLGRMFAMQELKLFLAVWCARFTFEPGAKGQVKHFYGMTMKPRNIAATVRLASREGVNPSSEKNNVDDIAKDVTLVNPTTHKEEDTEEITQARVFYASDHGEGRSMAFELVSLLRHVNIPTADICTLDQLVDSQTQDMDETRQDHYFIIASTYNGEPPRNGVHFATFLGNEGDSRIFWQGRKFCVFGLGNSEWRASFQNYPRYIDTRIEELGGKRVAVRGEGDAEYDLESDWRNWLANQIPRFSKNATAKLIQDVKQGKGPGRATEVQIIKHKDTTAPLQPSATICSIEEMQEVDQSGRSTLSVWINLESNEVAKPGDHIEIMPQNHEDIVATSLKALNLDPTTVITVSNKEVSSNLAAYHLQEPILLSDFFTHKVSLLSPPTQAMASILSSILQTKGFVHQSIKLASLLETVPQSIETVHRLLLLTSGYGLELSDWLSVLPSMRPRLYSVASCPMTMDEPVRLLVSVPADNRGQLTAFLRRSKAGTRLFACISSSNFRPPTEQSRLVMVAAGTGLAPFLSFLEAKKRQAAFIGCTTLVYGCRGSFDFLCKNELEQYKDIGILDHLFVAKSRDSASPYKYVGDAIRGQGDHVRSEVCGDQKATIYICGAASTMAVNARSALSDVVGDGVTCGAEDTLSVLRSQGKLLEDVWG